MKKLLSLALLLAALLPGTLPGQVVNPTFVQSGTGATVRTLVDKVRDTFHIKDFGAVTNGIADDTAAITAAMAACPTVGCTIYYSGTPLISSTITIDKALRLVGEGGKGDGVNTFPSAHFIKKSTMTTAAISITAAGAVMEGGGVRGQTGNRGDGIHVKTGRVTLRDVGVSNMGNDGIRIGTDATSGFNANLWLLDNVASKGNRGRGIYIHDNTTAGAEANGGTMVGGDIQSNIGDGLYVNRAALNSFTGVVSQTNGGIGIHLGTASIQNAFFGGDVEGNRGDDIKIEAGASENSFTQVPANPAKLTDLGSATAIIQRPIKGGWTPVLGGATSTAGQTYAAQYGAYIKVGPLVIANFRVILSAKGTIRGNLQLQGLPFASSTDTRVQGAGLTIHGFSAMATNWIQLRGVVPLRSNIVEIYGINAAGTSNLNLLTGSDIGNTTQMYGTVIYTAAH